MNEPTKVLVVDDSFAIRKVLKKLIDKRDDLDVIADARNGRRALKVLESEKPDAMVLDVEMPVMNGLETLQNLQETNPDLPVIMFSTETERGADITISALTKGADAYVPKPSSENGAKEAKKRIEEELIPKIRRIAGSHKDRRKGSQKTTQTSPKPSNKRTESDQKSKRGAPSSNRIDLVGMAVSTGGPEALLSVIPKLPSNFPAPIVIIQHMPETFIEQMAKRLHNQASIPVYQASAGDVLKPGSAYFAPDGTHSLIEKKASSLRPKTRDGEKINHCRPSADVLFESVANVLGPHALTVTMTGMGRDGFEGTKHVHQNSSIVYAQDKKSSVIWGMPKHPAKDGIADRVLALDELADAITKEVRRGR